MGYGEVGSGLRNRRTMRLIIKTSTGEERTHSGVPQDRVAALLKIMMGESRGPFVVGDPPTFYNPQYIVVVTLLYEGEARTDFTTLVDAGLVAPPVNN